MTTELATQATEERNTLVSSLAQQAGLDSRRYFDTIRAMCGCRNATNETFYALLTQAKRLDLDPLGSQIYIIDAKGGAKIVIPIDGYLRIMLRNPRYVSHVVTENNDSKGNPVSATIRIYTKEQVAANIPPFEHTEYMVECRGNSGPWRSHPRRMLKHKTVSQGVRYCFGAYLPDEDEWERAAEVESGKLPEKPNDALAALTASLEDDDASMEPMTVTAEVVDAEPEPFDEAASRALDAEIAAAENPSRLFDD